MTADKERIENEIIQRLEKIAKHAAHIKGEEPYIMSLDDGVAIMDAIDIIKSNQPEVRPMSDLISRQAAIKAVHEELDECLVWDESGEYTADEVERILDRVPSAQPEQRWIPCTERLPDTDDMMLVTCAPKKGARNVNRAYYNNGFWHGSGSMSGVIAWMPLPEPYTEETT